MDTPATQNKAVIDSLHRIPFFRSLPPGTFSAISAKLQKVHFENDEVVFVENSLGDSMYLIESGQVKVSVNTGAGQQERVINYLGPGNFFGEMALLTGQLRSATVTTIGRCRFLVLHQGAFTEILKSRPRVAQFLLRTLSERLSTTVSKAEEHKRRGEALQSLISRHDMTGATELIGKSRPTAKLRKTIDARIAHQG